ncbi:penicillin-binding protein 2 [Patescibacteria group bacterium]|nr:penicillin-binding protein 2 [Patescibacteria group bacterium]
MSWRVHERSKSNDDNRINVILAIIFLLGTSIIYRLYGLQIIEHDFYLAKASSQHKSENLLIPERGKILIEDNTGGVENLYPIATNKDFAFLYIVPKDIRKPQMIAETFYKYFNEKDIIEEVDKMYEEIDKERLERDLVHVQTLPVEEQAVKRVEITENHNKTMLESEFIEFRKLKKESEINVRKDVILTQYLAKITKQNDPYEPIEPKVDDDTLLHLYFELIKETDKSKLFYYEPNLSNSEVDTLLEGLTVDSLSIKNDTIIARCSDGVNRRIVLEGIAFFLKMHRYYPENNIGSHMLGFVRKEENTQIGKYGLEGFFDDELSGVFGSAEVDKGARGELIVINDMEYKKAKNGSDLVLTINRTIQYAICNMLDVAAEKHQADSAAVIIMNPETGEIVSMCSWLDYDPNNYKDVEDIAVFNNPIIFNAYEPGSVFKTFTIAAAIDRDKITPDTTYVDKGYIMVDGWPKPIKNSDYSTVGGHGLVDMNTVLEASLNTGSIFAMKQVSANVFADYVRKFGFGEKTGIELNGEVSGNLGEIAGDRIYDIYAATASFGQGIMTTPLQLASAFGAIANKGILMKPYVVKKIVDADGVETEINPKVIRRVISEKTAALVGGMLANVVESGHAKLAAVKGYWVGGKTGTAQVASKTNRGYGEETIHTFIGYAPIENPKFVMLVRIDNPKDQVYSAGSAAPLFGKMSEYLLDYWQVPRERK